MRRISVIVPLFRPPYIGGTETVLRFWKQFFKKNDAGMIFVLPFAYPKSNVFGESGNTKRVPFQIFNNEKMIKLVGSLYLFWYLIRTSDDIIITLSPKYIKIAYFIKKVFKKKYKIVSWIHFSLKEMFSDQSETFKRADYHLVISSGIRRQLISMGIPEEKIYLIYNPVERKSVTIQPSRAPRFVYIGRVELAHQKNLKELIEAFGLVLEKLPEATLDLWGDGADKSALEQVVEVKGISDNVNFHGWDSDPWSKITNATALVMTSTFEGLPMTILESISYGLPVISSDIETGPDDEVSAENGFLYKLGDIKSLASKMISQYEKSKIVEPEMIVETIEKFYVDRYFQNISEILKKIG